MSASRIDGIASDRPEKGRGKSLRWISFMASAVLVLVNARRLGLPFWGVAALIAGAAVFGLLLSRWILGDLKRLQSREALSEVVSRSRGTRRLSLAWYEYMIARNVVRGTYSGEPPAHFKSDVYEASMSMSLATRAARRQMLWTFVAMSIGMACVAAWVARGDAETGWVVAAIFAGVVVFTAVVTFGFTWFVSRTPRSQLGRRVEDASLLPTEERWQTMLQIASEEITTHAAA